MTAPVALVTGGGRNIGRAIALRLAQDGFDLVIVSRESAENQKVAAEIAARGRQALAIDADVSLEESVKRMVAQALEKLGRIDLLVNNAAVIGPTARVPEIRKEDWDDVLAVNLSGAFLCARAVLPRMMERRSGKLVNISSIAGKMAYALRSPYAVSKWGLIGLTLTMAKEMGEYNIQVNAICPGPVRGGRMDKIIHERAAELGQSVAEVEQTYRKTTLLGRFVEADDVAAMVAFLASPAGNNITGQAFDVTAGYGI